MKWLIFQIGNLITSLVAGITIAKYANSLTELIIYMVVSTALIVTFWIKLGEWWYKRQERIKFSIGGPLFDTCLIILAIILVYLIMKGA